MTDAPEVVRDDLFGARPATVDRHPILGLDPVNCTPQLGRPGPWSARLPYFRMGFTPSAGEELQSEYLVAREQAGAAIEAVRAPGRPHPPGAPRLRDPHGRRRPAVDEPAVRARQRRHPLHLGARARGRAAGARRPRAGARAVRSAPALGQALPATPRRRRATSACPTSRASPRRSIRAARSGTRGSRPGYWDHDDRHDLRHHRHRLALGVLPPPRARGARSPPRHRRRQPLRRARRRDHRALGPARVRVGRGAAARGGARLRHPVRPLGGDARRHARARRARRAACSPRRRPRRTCPACARSGPTSATAASSRSPSSTC